jgi:hypothetical protein
VGQYKMWARGPWGSKNWIGHVRWPMRRDSALECAVSMSHGAGKIHHICIKHSPDTNNTVHFNYTMCFCELIKPLDLFHLRKQVILTHILIFDGKVCVGNRGIVYYPYGN